MHAHWKTIVALNVLLFTCCVSAGQSMSAPETDGERVAGYANTAQFGGPNSVGAQVKSDDKVKQSSYRFQGFTQAIQPYYDFKARTHVRRGLAFGADYNVLFQAANDSIGDDKAASGALRLFGNWTLTGRDSTQQGSLVFKVENRHRLGTDIAPQALASELGYAGLTATPFSDAGSILTNLYWHQSMVGDDVAFVGGIVDTTDYLDVYGLVSSWSDFLNLAFSTNPTIAAPNQGLGLAFRVSFADHYYFLAGIADANGDPSDPLAGTFFSDREYFKHAEFGWVSSRAEQFNDNIHLSLWQADRREEADIAGGWGGSASFNHLINKRWLPFVRLGYSDGGGGALMERSASTGFAYYRQRKSDVIGFGVSWGRPSIKTYGADLNDEYTTELYYRLQLFQHTTITPNIQWLVDPALNPDDNQLWVVGLRVRLNL